MSATLSGALKALVESAGLGLPVYRDRPPAGAPLPYALVTEGIASAPEPTGDFTDPAREHEVREQAQVEVVQAWKAGDGSRLERYGLAQAVARALHGRTPQPVLGGRCWPVSVVAGPTRQPVGPGEDDNLIREVMTVQVLRVVTGSTV